jgi:ribonuclease H2 subunit A
VDALGATTPYEQLLSSQFPGIHFTVTTKADSKYKIVGAASVAAKVTRDAWIEGWVFEEDAHNDPDTSETPRVKKTWSTELGSGYPSGDYLRYLSCPQVTADLWFP